MPKPPCPRCLALALCDVLRVETVQPLPDPPWAPLARDRSGPCCHDCAAADTLRRLWPGGMSFEALRIAVANERQEQYRLPGVPMGLVAAGLVRPSKRGDFDAQLKWLDAYRWFEKEE